MIGTDAFNLSSYFDVEFDIINYLPEKSSGSGAEEPPDLTAYPGYDKARFVAYLNGNYATDPEGDNIFYRLTIDGVEITSDCT